MIDFRLDHDSGLPPYLQLVRQIRQAMRVGLLREGDQLPTVKDLSTRLAVNQNTILKALRELQYAGLLHSQAGVGTFVGVDIADASLVAHAHLHQELRRWLATACRVGFDNETIEALFSTTLVAVRGEPDGPRHDEPSTPRCT